MTDCVPLGEVVTLSQGLAINANTKHVLSDAGYPLLRITDLISGSFSQFVQTDLAPEKCLVEKGEIIYTRTGQVGMVFNKFAGVAHNNCFKVTPDETRVDRDFLYWFLRQPQIRDYANSIASGSVQKDLNHSSFKSIEILIPDKLHQHQVSKFLNQLEEKILSNQKMNQTLEEIAKAIFKSWFVDFDPVRAKAEGRTTGLPNEISDFFPDELVETEIGKIPKGWKPSPLGDFIIEVGKKIKPCSETKRNPYVPIDCISRKSLTLREYKYGEEAKSSLVSFKEKDILFGAMRPYFHKVCIAPFNGTTRTTCLVLSSKQKDYFSFALFTLFSDSTIDFATQNSTGSTIPYIKWKNELEKLCVALPPVELTVQFNSILNPILKKFRLDIKEHEVLCDLRDTLLPKLISGELKIPDAEKFLKEVGI